MKMLCNKKCIKSKRLKSILKNLNRKLKTQHLSWVKEL